MDTDDDLFVSAEEFNFFLTVPSDEKILCLYDLMFDTDVPGPTIKEIIDASIQNPDAANVVISNDLIVINGDKYETLRIAARYFHEMGYVLDRLFLEPSAMQIYQRQKYCMVYEIVGTVPAFEQN